MAKQKAPLEFNRLSGGIITEASPLTFPDNASIDEVNFTINSDGTRSRRLGLSLENGAEFTMIPEGLYSSGNPNVVNSFLWENVSGENVTSLLVVQGEGHILIYSTLDPNTSANLVGELDLHDDYVGKQFGFASVNGNLVIVTGSYDVITVVANLSSETVPTFTQYRNRLTIRDLFGVEVKYSRAGEGIDDYVSLEDPEYTNKRPLVSGLPNVGEVQEPVNVTTPSTTNTTTTYGGGGFAGVPSYVTTVITTGAVGGFSPSNIYGHTIASILTSKWTKVTEGIFGGTSSGTSDAVILFNTVPEYSKITVFDSRTGLSYQFTQSVQDGREFRVPNIPNWEGRVPAGFNFTFTVDTGTLRTTTYNYNLRNQTFAVKRLPKTGTVSEDPIESFLTLAGKLPSMSDSVLSALYNNVEDADNKTVDRFHAEDLLENPLGSSPAPRGYFIIDALERSSSRKERWSELITEEGLINEAVDLPLDTTPTGPLAVTEYGGRLWYAGFSEKGTITVGGGTRLESYLLFSQLASNKAVLTRCYQAGDPTSLESPEALDTDGGFLSLDGAYGIKRMVNVGVSLLIFAENGVWAVSGDDGNYFTPNSPRVDKINDKGCTSASSIVIVDNSVIYWARDGIYIIEVSSLGEYKQDNLTEKTIQTLYSEIDFVAKNRVLGAYDPYRNAVDWVVYNTVDRVVQTEILTLKTDTGAFTKSVISDTTESDETTLVGLTTLPPYTLQAHFEIVTVGGVNVTVEEALVTISDTRLGASTATTKGMVIRQGNAGVSELSFGEFTNQNFEDWGNADAPAYMITGYVSGGDFQRHKQLTYATFHFERTEDGFELDDSLDIVPSHQSGCLVQAQWDWANSPASGRWSREFQAYRYRRLYLPEDVFDTYDYGFSTIVTRNKIRGKGRVLSMQIKTEPGKDCRLLGWSAIMEVRGNV